MLNAGNTTVNEGTLVLTETAGPAILGATFATGDAVGGPGADVVRYGPAAVGNQISDSTGAGINPATVAVRASGLLDLNGKSDTLASNGLGINANLGLTMEVGPLSAAEIRTGTGTLTLGGSLSVLQQNAALTSAATPSALIGGNLSHGPTGIRTIVVNDGAAADDLIITANITGGADGTPG